MKTALGALTITLIIAAGCMAPNTTSTINAEYWSTNAVTGTIVHNKFHGKSPKDGALAGVNGNMATGAYAVGTAAYQNNPAVIDASARYVTAAGQQWVAIIGASGQALGYLTGEAVRAAMGLPPGVPLPSAVPVSALIPTPTGLSPSNTSPVIPNP